MGLLENWTNSLQEKQGSGTTSQKGFDAQIASTEKQIQDTLAEIGKIYVQQHGLDCFRAPAANGRQLFYHLAGADGSVGPYHFHDFVFRFGNLRQFFHWHLL